MLKQSDKAVEPVMKIYLYKYIFIYKYIYIYIYVYIYIYIWNTIGVILKSHYSIKTTLQPCLKASHQFFAAKPIA